MPVEDLLSLKTININIIMFIKQVIKFILLLLHIVNGNFFDRQVSMKIHIFNIVSINQDFLTNVSVDK